MQRQQLVEELKTLMDLVERNTTALADSVMEIDVKEYTTRSSSSGKRPSCFAITPSSSGPVA